MKANWFVGLPVAAEAWLPRLLADAPDGVRRFHPADVHLTVAFLGRCGKEAALAAWSVADGFSAKPIDIELGELRAFGNPRRPSALSVVLNAGQRQVVALIEQLRDPMCEAAGTRLETRLPSPHITVARPPRRAKDKRAPGCRGMGRKQSCRRSEADARPPGALHLGGRSPRATISTGRSAPFHMTDSIEFTGTGPFDAEEQAVICDVMHAVRAANMPEANKLLSAVRRNVAQLDKMGELLASYPSLFGERLLGSRKRSLHSLVDQLIDSNLSNFDMFLPGRALVSRNLVMGEVSFYRLLRVVCDEALPEEQRNELKPRVDARLCHCLYTRLAEEVLKHIASDNRVAVDIREKAALSLVHLWELAAYRVSDFFPVLQATWEARRRVPVTLGTLMGTAEMFRLIQAGCDERFVDYLVRPDHSEGEAAAFREFLFGATTEQLDRMQTEMSDSGRSAIGTSDLADADKPCDAHTIGGDPALAMFEFFLSRHLQAAARRQADIPGPKRTAEEYVMLHYLEQSVDKEVLSVPPPASV